ncbi:hypothetical protein M407DRAFT_66027, partial [Tulasnella calospora MUT 4182]
MSPSGHVETTCTLWNTVKGHEVIQKIVQKRIPEWVNGAHPWQLPLVARTLDQRHSITVTATGDGKSALFYLPLLVHMELAMNPSLWPQMAASAKKSPAAIIVLPVSAIAATLVPEITEKGLTVVTLTKATIDAARRAKQDLFEQAKTANIILLGPEQLLSRRFDLEVLRSREFRARLCLTGIDEVHFVDYWGAGFREAYSQLGYLHARIPSHVPIVCASATITPRFPDIDWTLSCDGKVVVFCRTMELCDRVTAYLRSKLPGSSNKHDIVRVYNSLVAPEDNDITKTLFMSTSSCKVVVATVGFGCGLNLRDVRFSVSLGDP